MGVRLSKFTAGSIIATVLSQVTLTGLYGWGHTSATLASVVAVAVGAVPAFVINWKWTWGRNGRPSLVRELAPYVAVIATGGLAATGLTTLTDHFLSPLLTNHAWRTVTLDAAYVASYAILFVAKFALLNKVFATKGKPQATEPAGQGV
jgi:putative flippase GtrA